jgi:hypothetical protein
MKGKKVDNSFVSEYISESCANGKCTPDEIVKSALAKVCEIDEKIIEVENLKKLRSKLKDVIIVFNRNQQAGPQLDSVLINFYRMKDKKLAQLICDKIFSYSNVSEIRKAFPSTEEIFCVKQLLEFNILQRFEETIKAGENFPAFKSFIKENYEVNR